MDACMKAKDQAKEWNSESRVRENRLHGLMRGRRCTASSPEEQSALDARSLSPTLRGNITHIVKRDA
jgi:hypothetical protein